jgi:hypothetical protein
MCRPDLLVSWFLISYLVQTQLDIGDRCKIDCSRVLLLFIFTKVIWHFLTEAWMGLIQWRSKEIWDEVGFKNETGHFKHFRKIKLLRCPRRLVWRLVVWRRLAWRLDSWLRSRIIGTEAIYLSDAGCDALQRNESTHDHGLEPLARKLNIWVTLGVTPCM